MPVNTYSNEYDIDGIQRLRNKKITPTDPVPMTDGVRQDEPLVDGWYQRSTTPTQQVTQQEADDDPGEQPAGGGGGDGGDDGGDDGEEEETPPAELVKIRAGAQWFKVIDPMGSDEAARWFAAYQIPGTNLWYTFEADEKQMEAIFGEGNQPPGQIEISGTAWDNKMRNESYFYGGGIAEMESASEESFASAYERALMQGLGVGTIPSSLQGNAEVQGLIFLAEQEDWSDERFGEELSKTAAFQQRFPHIAAFKKENLNVLDSVEAYLEYETSTNKLARQILGTDLTIEQIGSFISKNHSMNLVQATFEQYRNIQQNERALLAFNEVLAARGIEPLSGMALYEFMGGNSEPELYDIYEESAILEAARGANLSFLNAADARELAAVTRGRTTYEAAYEGLSQAAELVLRYRHQLNMEEVNADDLVDLALGIAPRSGADVAELGRTLQRLTSQARAYIEDRRSPSRGFTRQGRPESVTLSGSRQAR